MKKFFILFAILIFTTNICQAENFNSQIMLDCDHSGVEKCKYDIILKQALLVNDLQLSTSQKKELDNLFNVYGDARATIMNDIRINKETYETYKANKASLKLKSEQKSKLQKSRNALKNLDKSIEKDVKKILTREQRHKYNVFKDSLF